MDAFIFEKINQYAFKNPWIAGIGVFFADWFPFIIAFGLILLLVLNFRKHRTMVVLSFLAAGLSRAITELFRLALPRYRPFVNGSVNLLANKVEAFSFPSAHTAFFFAIFVVLYFFNKKLSFIFLIATLLIGGSRVLGGVHWPSDILGGILVGGFSGLLVVYLYNKLKK